VYMRDLRTGVEKSRRVGPNIRSRFTQLHFSKTDVLVVIFAARGTAGYLISRVVSQRSECRVFPLFARFRQSDCYANGHIGFVYPAG